MGFIKTIEEARKNKYGTWGGNPKGFAYIEGECIEEVFSNYISHQCHKKIWKDGFCKQHHPETIAEKTRKQKERLEEKRKQSPHYKLQEALGTIAVLRRALVSTRKCLNWVESELGSKVFSCPICRSIENEIARIDEALNGNAPEEASDEMDSIELEWGEVTQTKDGLFFRFDFMSCDSDEQWCQLCETNEMLKAHGYELKDPALEHDCYSGNLVKKKGR